MSSSTSAALGPTDFNPRSRDATRAIASLAYCRVNRTPGVDRLMSEGRVERRLAAILAADVVGYSRLMGADEEGTLAALRSIRRELSDPKIAEHHGRIVKTTGDGLLAEFQASSTRYGAPWRCKGRWPSALPAYRPTGASNSASGSISAT